MAPLTDSRFTVPLYTVAESARFLGVAPSTFATWAKGYERQPPGRPKTVSAPVLTSVEAPLGEASIPFVGLAEGMVLAAFRHAGVSMQHVRRAARILNEEIGLAHVLASKRLYSDGAVVLFDAKREDDEELANLTQVVSQQRVFAETIAEYLERITYDDEDWASRLISPATREKVIVIDPTRSFGQPIFLKGAARVEDVLDRWRAGERLTDVAADFGVPFEDVEDYLRGTVPAAA